ncbi:hypothetical protein C1I98_34695 [Spongiactinospora gelatinilytica]|uniref:Uncharacterized protein n=1 Tax=Spongiactinospora gelatinilytica TaxID=2666298 RepID=A0A2W2FJ32_9ACTN|nr:hypothetical protein [Spongiactinospora gelatinilytica]PZG25360.1 hypothetical protein C1I98_34695 [Spongiactinospora gelatinilytica]
MHGLDRTAMEAVVARIQRMSDEHGRALDDSCRLLADDAWLGPAAVRFGQEVHGLRHDLRSTLARALADARAGLAVAR